MHKKHEQKESKKKKSRGKARKKLKSKQKRAGALGTQTSVINERTKRRKENIEWEEGHAIWTHVRRRGWALRASASGQGTKRAPW